MDLAISSPRIKELQNELINERLKSEQYRLNYEKSKAVNVRLEFTVAQLIDQHRKNQARDKTYDDTGGGGDNNNGSNAQETLNIPNKNPQANEAEAEATVTNPRTSMMVKNSVEMAEAVNFWKRMYITVLDKYERFKTETKLKLDDIIKESDIKIFELMNEKDLIKEEYEKKDFSLRTNCKELNREKATLQAKVESLEMEVVGVRNLLTEQTSQVQSLKKTLHETQNLSLSQMTNSEGQHQTGLRTQLRMAEKRNSQLEYEIQELRSRCDLILEQYTKAGDSHECTTQELKRQLLASETLLVEERKEFEEKYTEIKSMLENQQTYMKDIDKFLIDQDDQINRHKEQLSEYAGQAVLDANSTILLIQDKITKNREEVQLLYENLDKCVQIIHFLKEEPTRCKTIIDEFTEDMLRLLATCSGPANSMDYFQNINKNLIAESSTFLINNSSDEPGEGRQPGQVRRNIEMLMKQIKEQLLNIVNATKFWKEEQEARRLQNNKRVEEIEKELAKAQKKLEKEGVEFEKKSKEFQNTIRILSSKLIKAKEIVKNFDSARHIFLPAKPGEGASTGGGGGDARETGPSGPKTSNSVDFVKLQKKHLRFRDIVDHIEKYVTKPSPDQSDEPSRQ